jgi:murein DD-endopeptidase MepM/ murein hydrolase activator NlpD
MSSSFYQPHLDGVRALSILLVTIAHGGLGHVVPGGLGVTVFFFISGYLITALLVKEDQAVRRGQKIADMGSSDAERVQLHFEIRKQGKPVDPAKLLPPR